GFADLARGYVAAHPSTEPSIRHLGRALPAFLAGYQPAYLVDLARLEWTRLEVFDAPDATPLTAADLRRIAPEDWPGLRFTLVPACARLVTRWPVHRLWDDAAAPLAPARTALRVWREGFLVYHTAMDPAEEAALDRLVAGEPFAAVCEGFDDPAEALQEVFWELWRAAGEYDPRRGSPEAWVTVRARSRGIDRVRSVRRREEMLVAPLGETAAATSETGGNPVEDRELAQGFL